MKVEHNVGLVVLEIFFSSTIFMISCSKMSKSYYNLRTPFLGKKGSIRMFFEILLPGK